EPKNVAHHFLGKRQVKAVLRCETHCLQARVDFEEQVRKPFGRSTSSGVDGVLSAGDSLLYCEPAQRQTELWAPVADLDVLVDGTDLQLHFAESNNGITGLLQKAAG